MWKLGAEFPEATHCSNLLVNTHPEQPGSCPPTSTTKVPTGLPPEQNGAPVRGE